MITKILFTIMVIAAVLGTARYRAAKRSAQPPLVRVQSALATPPNPWPRRAAYGFSAVVALGSALYFLTTWHDDRRVMSIKVVNSKTGETTLYQAYKRDITPNHSFVTVDGWSIRVSDAERVEISEAR